MTELARCVSVDMQLLGQEFRHNELAYLALTSKVELPIRDRLAYLLHRRFESKCNVEIAREWKNFDLAVISGGNVPLLLLEIKAMYSFDLFSGNSDTRFPGKVMKDVNKLRGFQHATAEPDLLSMILVTRPHVAPAHDLDGIVKYGKEIRRPRE